MRPIYETACLIWPKGGTVIIHPALTAADAATLTRCVETGYVFTALSTAPSGTRPVVR